jgi:hypothetical protein
MIARGAWQGMLTIARFNWPLYAAASAMLISALVAAIALPQIPIRIAAGLVAAGSAYFLLGSLAVSHEVYDRSDLYRWKWLERALRDLEPTQAILCHSGFDEVSASLQEHLGEVEWRILDHFDETQMTEASIRRARRMFPPLPRTLPAPFNAWPVPEKSADVVFGLLAIHELRKKTERSAWFAEAKRCLRRGGRIVVVEHTRDLANLLAFGPGVLHFHSPASWRRCWFAAGLHLLEEFRITPWVRVFVIAVE